MDKRFKIFVLLVLLVLTLACNIPLQATDSTSTQLNLVGKVIYSSRQIGDIALIDLNLTGASNVYWEIEIDGNKACNGITDSTGKINCQYLSLVDIKSFPILWISSCQNRTELLPTITNDPIPDGQITAYNLDCNPSSFVSTAVVATQTAIFDQVCEEADFVRSNTVWNENGASFTFTKVFGAGCNTETVINYSINVNGEEIPVSSGVLVQAFDPITVFSQRGNGYEFSPTKNAPTITVGDETITVPYGTSEFYFFP